MAQDDILSKAKKTLAGADAFSKSADPAGRFKPQPISMPKAPVVEKPAGMGAELKAKQDNVLEYTKQNAVPKMHKGGTVENSGVHVVNLEKGEKFTVEPKDKSMADEKEPMEKEAKEPKEPKAEAKPAKKASPAALMTSEDGAKPKAAGKPAGKSKGGEFTETRVEHHNAGGHHVHHKHKNNPDKDVHYAAQDMEGVKAGLDQHIGGGAGQAMPQEPEAAPNAEITQAATPPAASAAPGGAPGAMPQV